jgi:hypothetical protein
MPSLCLGTISDRGINSNQNPLHLIHRRLVISPIVERRCAPRLKRRHLLCQLASATVAQLMSDRRSPRRLITDPDLDSHRERPSANHSIDIGLGEGIGCQCSAAPAHRPKLITFEISGEAWALLRLS